MGQFERAAERQPEFCRRHGVGLSAFQHWLYRLRREQRGAATPSARFVPVVVSPATTDGAACRLRLSGAEVSFATLPPAAYVAELLRLMDR